MEQLAAAHAAVAEKGWEKLSDLHRLLSIDLSSRAGPSSVARVTQLLQRYLNNYHPVTETVTCLLQAHENGAAELTSEMLGDLDRRLTQDLRYDFRPRQDRFFQSPRLPGGNYAAFIDDLQAMVREVEEVRTHEQQILNALAGNEDLLRLRTENGSNADRQELRHLLSRAEPNQPSLLDLYQHMPSVSRSTVAMRQMKRLTDSSWFRLLERAVALTSDRRSA